MEIPPVVNEGQTATGEMVGCLAKGKLDVTLHGETANLGEGDSWLGPAGANHQCQIIEDIVAIEATSRSARLGCRDETRSRFAKAPQAFTLS